MVFPCCLCSRRASELTVDATGLTLACCLVIPIKTKTKPRPAPSAPRLLPDWLVRSAEIVMSAL